MILAHGMKREEASHARWRPIAILDVYSLLIAVFLFASPWLFAYANKAAQIDLWASSVLVGLASAVAVATLSNWEEWLNLSLGVWLMLAPWVLGFPHARAMHMSVVVGGVVAYLAGLRLWLTHYQNPTGREIPSDDHIKTANTNSDA